MISLCRENYSLLLNPLAYILFLCLSSFSIISHLKECMNPCCNASTCTLKVDAVCAHGQCCHDCQVWYVLIGQPWYISWLYDILWLYDPSWLYDISYYISWLAQSSRHIFLSFPLALCPHVWCFLSTFHYSWSQQALHAVNPFTLVICLSSAPAPALTAPPTSTCTTATPATTWTATVITASARLTSSNASHCGDQVRGRPPSLAHTGRFGDCRRLFDVIQCVLQEQSQPRASAFKESTQQETLTATAARTPKAPLPNVKHGKIWRYHRNQWKL